MRIKKATNGQDADNAPGPTVPVGSTVTWTYVVTNTGNVPLTAVVVRDDPNGPVPCPRATLAAGESMTCTTTGVGDRRAVPQRRHGDGGLERRIGLGFRRQPLLRSGRDDEEEGPKVQLCHRTGNGSYHLIEVSVNAEPAHRAHGDGKIGEAVPGQSRADVRRQLFSAVGRLGRSAGASGAGQIESIQVDLSS